MTLMNRPLTSGSRPCMNRSQEKQKQLPSVAKRSGDEVWMSGKHWRSCAMCWRYIWFLSNPVYIINYAIRCRNIRPQHWNSCRQVFWQLARSSRYTRWFSSILRAHFKTLILSDRSGQKYRDLKSGLKAGLNKINIYIENALVGDYLLLGAAECFPLSLMYIGSHAVIKFYIHLFAYHTSKTYQNGTTLSQHMQEFYWSTYMTHTRKTATLWMQKNLQEQTQWSPSSCRPSRTWHLQIREWLSRRLKVFLVAHIPVWMVMYSSGGRYIWLLVLMLIPC